MIKSVLKNFSIIFFQQQLNVQLQLIQKSNEAHGPKPLQITGYADKIEAARLYIQEHFCNMVPAKVDEICLKENADALDELYVAQVIVLGIFMYI